MTEQTSLPKPTFSYKKPSRLKRLLKKIISLTILLGLLVGAWFGYQYWVEKNTPKINFRTTKITERPFEHVIEATGTLEPEDLIDVGAQVGGRIIEFGKDTRGREVDYGSVVKEGDVLARIDDVLILSDIARAEASVASAKANIALSEASLEDARIKHELAKAEKERAEQLGAKSEALAKSAYDTYITAEKSARVAIQTQEASLARAKAALIESQATLEREQRNLSYTKIISPVDGIIIDRRVNIGQTVVSSMSAPSLFLIAKDLSKLQIWVAVNEADISLVKEGQDVVFTVDAFQGREFKGTVEKIRLNATMTSNVVTYIVEVSAPNPDKTLLPYLTANTKFIVKRWDKALVVSNAALRWAPELDMVAPGTPVPKGSRVWVKEGEHVRPLDVEVVQNNGTLSIITGPDIKDGLEVVSGIELPVAEATNTGETTNPFAPKMPRRGGSSGRSGSSGGSGGGSSGGSSGARSGGGGPPH